MNRICSALASKRGLPGGFNLISALAIISILLLAACPARGEDPDAQYLQIYETIQQGDMLKKNGEFDKALAKYKEAQVALTKFQRSHPERNSKIVAYRSTYVANQIATLAAQDTGSATDSASGGKSGASTGLTQIKLVEPGAEPRNALRFHPKAGDKQSMLLTMKIAMGVKIGEAENPPMKLPTIKMAMDVMIKDVASNGDINYEIVMSDADIEPDPEVIAQVAEAMKTALAGAKGLSGSGTISSRGVNKVTNIKAPEGADPQLTQFIDQMKETMSRVATPLPEEPVGPGAKWEVKTPVKSQGMTINQTEQFELASIDGDRAAAKTTTTQTASNQKIQNPMMAGAKVDMSKMTGKGTGEVTLDLAHILPVEASAEYHQDMAMSMSNGGQKQTMAMKMDLSLHVESK